MKKIRNKFLALLLITTVAVFSCKKEDPIRPTMPTTSSVTTNNPTLSRGEWRIALFQDNGADETNQFNKHLFMFNANGTLMVKIDSSMMSGTWSTQHDNDQIKFIINFASSPLSKLNKVWFIKKETFSDLKLEYVHSDGMIDYLSFKRNQQEGVKGSVE